VVDDVHFVVAMTHHILIVDDQAGIRKSLRGVLEDEGYTVSAVETGEECLVELKKRSYDLVLLDNLAAWNGWPCSHGADPHFEQPPEVIIISGHGTIESAVRATKLGAYDFMEKPLSFQKLMILVKNALEARRLRQDNRELRQQQPLGDIVGDSVPMKALRQQIALYGARQRTCTHLR